MQNISKTLKKIFGFVPTRAKPKKNTVTQYWELLLFLTLQTYCFTEFKEKVTCVE